MNQPYDNDPWNASSTEPAKPAPAEHADDAEQSAPATTAGSPTPLSTLTKTRLALAWSCIGICTIALIVLQSLGMEAMQDAYADDPRPGFNALYLARYATGSSRSCPEKPQR